MRHNVDAWQIIRVPNRYLSQGLLYLMWSSMKITLNMLTSWMYITHGLISRDMAYQFIKISIYFSDIQ